MDQDYETGGSFIKGVVSALTIMAIVVVLGMMIWKAAEIALNDSVPDWCKMYQGAEVSACVLEVKP